MSILKIDMRNLDRLGQRTLKLAIIHSFLDIQSLYTYIVREIMCQFVNEYSRK
jgi:hypothetical protein